MTYEAGRDLHDVLSRAVEFAKKVCGKIKG
jgi:hypothetical protein